MSTPECEDVGNGSIYMGIKLKGGSRMEGTLLWADHCLVRRGK